MARESWQKAPVFLRIILFISAAFLVAPITRAAYQPPLSQQVGGYECTPLISVLLRSKDSARQVPLNRLVVPVQVNGHPTTLQVDTGASGPTINPSFLKPLEVDPLLERFRVKTAQINGHLVAMLNLRTFSIGRLLSRDIRGTVTVGNGILVNQGASAGFSVAGLLGGDYFRHHGAIVDCGRANLYLQMNPKAKSLTASLAGQGWTAVPLTFTAGDHITVPVTIHGVTGRLFVDTGAPYTLINASVMKRLQLAGTGKFFTAKGLYTQDDKAQIGTLDGLAVGGYQSGKMDVAISKGWQDILDQESGRGRCLGILGIDYLCEHQAVIDYGTRTLYLKARPK